MITHPYRSLSTAILNFLNVAYTILHTQLLTIIHRSVNPTQSIHWIDINRKVIKTLHHRANTHCTFASDSMMEIRDWFPEPCNWIVTLDIEDDGVRTAAHSQPQLEEEHMMIVTLSGVSLNPSRESYHPSTSEPSSTLKAPWETSLSISRGRPLLPGSNDWSGIPVGLPALPCYIHRSWSGSSAALTFHNT